VVVGAALAVVGAAAPAAYSQSADDQVVTASVSSLVSLTAGADVNLGVLDPLNGAGNNDGTGTFDVSSNVPYTVSVESSSAAMDNAGTPLTAPLAMDATTSAEGVGSLTNSGAANAVGGALIGTNTALLGAGSGDGTDSYTVNYLQPSSYLDAPGNYSITLTYTAAQII
jgi:hypothetical protein